jgi:hypothetical protein
MATALHALEVLDADQRERVLAWLVAKLGVTGATIGRAPGSTATIGRAVASVGSVKDFIKQKAPADDVARATALAYFLTHARGTATYSTRDLTKARFDAAMATFNLSRAVSNAQRAGYLTSSGRPGSYQITATGESLVEAMADDQAVQAARSRGRRRRRKPTSAARNATASESHGSR